MLCLTGLLFLPALSAAVQKPAEESQKAETASARQGQRTERPAQTAPARFHRSRATAQDRRGVRSQEETPGRTQNGKHAAGRQAEDRGQKGSVTRKVRSGTPEQAAGPQKTRGENGRRRRAGQAGNVSRLTTAKDVGDTQNVILHDAHVAVIERRNSIACVDTKSREERQTTVRSRKKPAAPYCYPYASPQAPIRSAILYNMTTGQILYQHNPDMQIPPASLTKVMTLFLAMDAVKQGRISLKKIIRVSRLAARTGGSSMHLRTGDRVRFSKLLMGTAVPSGNDAATAVAQTVNSNLQKFVGMMNARAKALGMTRTHFCNPTGLPAPGQLTTVSDMLRLALAYLKKHPNALNFHNVTCFMHGGRLLTTTNTLLSMAGVNGLKTGWTIASGYNIIVTAQRGNTRLMLVVMGGRSRMSRDVTARRLIEAGFRTPTSPRFVRSAFLSKQRGKHLTRKS